MPHSIPYPSYPLSTFPPRLPLHRPLPCVVASIVEDFSASRYLMRKSNKIYYIDFTVILIVIIYIKIIIVITLLLLWTKKFEYRLG